MTSSQQDMYKNYNIPLIASKKIRLHSAQQQSNIVNFGIPSNMQTVIPKSGPGNVEDKSYQQNDKFRNNEGQPSNTVIDNYSNFRSHVRNLSAHGIDKSRKRKKSTMQQKASAQGAVYQNQTNTSCGIKSQEPALYSKYATPDRLDTMKEDGSPLGARLDSARQQSNIVNFGIPSNMQTVIPKCEPGNVEDKPYQQNDKFRNNEVQPSNTVIDNYSNFRSHVRNLSAHGIDKSRKRKKSTMQQKASA